MHYSPLRASDSAANRGRGANTRKRDREDDMSSPAPLPPSSRMFASLSGLRQIETDDVHVQPLLWAHPLLRSPLTWEMKMRMRIEV